jgi:hypothetical protein
MKKNIMLLLLLVGGGTLFAQDIKYQRIDLQTMSDFRSQAGNWQIVGDVTINPTIDIHRTEIPAPATEGKKKKKTSEVKPAAKLEAVTFQKGAGILLNLNSETQKDNLVTSFEHGDIELELDVMIPKGSNSGIYLQGRYEVQLLDSWGVKTPSFSDIGGIYRNWENTPGKIFMGKAPISNAAKAPGLWQTFKISFRAPTFDANGKKITNAKFNYVELNGIRIHENLEVPLPTGGPIENNEKAAGPLMIQGDHGPVAFRNIKYRLLRENKVTLTDVSYKTYHGKFKGTSEFQNLKPVATGAQPMLSIEAVDKEDQYAAIFSGKLNVPVDDEYIFTLRFSGGGNFLIDGKSIHEYPKADGYTASAIKKVTLTKGAHDFEFYNFKDVSWIIPLLGIWVESSTLHPKPLHAFESYPPIEDPSGSIFLNAGDSPRLLRAFLDFKGDRSKRLTHTIGVGDPSGINYVYDLNAGNLVCAWRGAFVDATPMWHDRGDGSFKPRGNAQYFFTTQPLGVLQNGTEPFAEKSSASEFKPTGYRIEEKTNRPIFTYEYKGSLIEDRIYPDDENRSLTHEVNASKPLEKLFYKLAEGKSITLISDGMYAIDDKQYYVKVDPSSTPTIRDVNGIKELILPMAGTSLKYTLIW